MVTPTTLKFESAKNVIAKVLEQLVTVMVPTNANANQASVETNATNANLGTVEMVTNVNAVIALEVN